MGFKHSEYEHAIYRHINGDATFLIGVYVDDLIITGSSKGAAKSFKDEMKTKFQMIDLGLLSFYLGIEAMSITMASNYVDHTMPHASFG